MNMHIIYIYVYKYINIGVSNWSFIVPFAPGADRYEHRAERSTAETVFGSCE